MTATISDTAIDLYTLEALRGPTCFDRVIHFRSLNPDGNTVWAFLLPYDEVTFQQLKELEAIEDIWDLVVLTEVISLLPCEPMEE